LSHRVREADDPPPIGRPLANTSIFILDRDGTPVPDLAPGELMIGGEGLARGYRGDHELTAARFAPFPRLGAERLYRTGDLVRRRGDGAVEFLGRTDNQVKIRGFRIGLEEVETALAKHPRIGAAAVRARPDPSGESSLTAYVAGDSLSEADVPELRRFLRDLLPAYMIPTHFMPLPALPMTASGKIDRQRLPAPRPTGAPRGRRPRDDLERTLVGLWREVLGLPAVGLDDDFFDLGGHSLLACMLMARIEAVLGRELPLVTLFQSPTIASLADTLRSADEPAFSHLVPLRPTGVGSPLFIVHGIFGNVLQLKALAERLPVPRPVHALQARGVDPRQEPHASIAEMVGAYVAAVRQAQPRGPYALAGYSYGGLVAYEMARALRAGGETVELLALIETELYARFLPWPDKLGYWLELARRVAAKVGASPLRSVPAYLASKARQFGHRMQLRAGLRDDFVTFDEVNGPMSERYRRMYAIGVDEFRRFRPGPYDGKLSLFQIGGVRYDACDPRPIWRRSSAAVELFEIEGEHNRVMEEPFVGALAAQLGRCLAELAVNPPARTGAERAAKAGDRRLAKAWAWPAP
jgi:thioesterase domain-containing protein